MMNECRWIVVVHLVKKKGQLKEEKNIVLRKIKYAFLSTSLLYICIRVVISQFAHHRQTIKCRAHGGIQIVVTRVYWLEHINMDVKCTVKYEQIRRYALSHTVVLVKGSMIRQRSKSKFLYYAFFLLVRGFSP
jgi:hypothetical protein